MDILHIIVFTVLTLCIVVAVHEYGHFQVARWCGVKVLRFSIGFGPALLRRHDRYGTEYRLAAIPLGGYVKMLESRSPLDPGAPADANADMSAAFDRKPIAQRAAIAAAGPIANFILAIAAYWCVGIIGESGIAPVVSEVRPGSPAAIAGVQAGHEIAAVDGRATPTRRDVGIGLIKRMGDSGRIRLELKYPGSDIRQRAEAPVENWLAGPVDTDPLRAFGLQMYRPPVPPELAEVMPESPAAAAGLLPGDLILSADGAAMAEWGEWVDYVRARPETPIALSYERGGLRHRAELVPARRAAEGGEDIGLAGVAVRIPPYPASMQRQFHFGFAEAARRTGEMAAFTLQAIGKMAAGLISPKNLNGPITIAKVASDTAERGPVPFISFIALLSVSLGVLNLLPIPMLDGGHLLYYAVEFAAGRPLPERVQAIGYQLGLALILGVMGLAIFNDIARL